MVSAVTRLELILHSLLPEFEPDSSHDKRLRILFASCREVIVLKLPLQHRSALALDNGFKSLRISLEEHSEIALVPRKKEAGIRTELDELERDLSAIHFRPAVHVHSSFIPSIPRPSRRRTRKKDCFYGFHLRRVAIYPCTRSEQFVSLQTRYHSPRGKG